ncbi:hypothetical protein ACLKA6_010277 [Drosophila palustris]
MFCNEELSGSSRPSSSVLTERPENSSCSKARIKRQVEITGRSVNNVEQDDLLEQDNHSHSRSFSSEASSIILIFSLTVFAFF